MKAGASLIAEVVVLRARERIRVGGRWVFPYSLHRGLFVTDRATAAELVYRGAAKLPGGVKRKALIVTEGT